MQFLCDALERGCINFAEELLNYSVIYTPYFVFHDAEHSERAYSYARLLLEVGKRLNVAENCALRCASYLHDLGLAYNPNEWEKLNIGKDYVLKDVADDEFRNYIHQSKFFQSGILSLPSEWRVQQPLSYSAQFASSDLNKRFELVKVIRKLHPWISARIVEVKLPYEIRRRMYVELDPGLKTILSHLCRLHSPYVGLMNYVRHKIEVWGVSVNVGLLAAALRLGDALDCTADRAGRAAYESHVRDIVALDCSQLKHWVFKQYIEAVKIRGRDIVIRMNASDPHAVLGVALFEIGSNIRKDYLEAHEIFKHIRGVELNLLLEVPGLGTAQLTEKDFNTAEKLNKRKDTFNVALKCDCVTEKARSILRECENRLKRLGNCDLDAFDVLAHLCSLRDESLGDPDCLVHCLDKGLGLSSGLSPELRNLLQLG